MKLIYQIRNTYQLKRKTKKWKDKKKKAKQRRRHKIIDHPERKQKGYLKITTPENFSFIDNTNEVLEYFEKCKKYLDEGINVDFDISAIKKLTPDAISLLVSKINDPKYIGKGNVSGGAPNDPNLRELFIKSGFYNFVGSSKLAKDGEDKENNILHKERDYKVRPSIAMNACIHGLKFIQRNKIVEPFEPLYEILIEAMQNTNNHASPGAGKKIKWWMYVYNDVNLNVSKYCFLDLGVGIFESIVYKNYVKELASEMDFIPNSVYVNDLLTGKIQSRINEDNELRGKGIPQIVQNASLECFSRFYIISNDLKIDIKTKTHETLNYNFSGTFIYWELK